MTKPEVVDMWEVDDPSTGSTIGIGLYSDGTGWATFHDGGYVENTDFELDRSSVNDLPSTVAKEAEGGGVIT